MKLFYISIICFFCSGFVSAQSTLKLEYLNVLEAAYVHPTTREMDTTQFKIRVSFNIDSIQYTQRLEVTFKLSDYDVLKVVDCPVVMKENKYYVRSVDKEFVQVYSAYASFEIPVDWQVWKQTRQVIIKAYGDSNMESNLIVYKR